MNVAPEPGSKFLADAMEIFNCRIDFRLLSHLQSALVECR